MGLGFQEGTPWTLVGFSGFGLLARGLGLRAQLGQSGL